MPATHYQNAKEIYAARGVDTEAALTALANIPISMHCWQGDDVNGFENSAELGGGLAATGNYLGKARTADELRADIEQAVACIPGPLRVGLHALYAEPSTRVERDALLPEHFTNWIDWAKANSLALDFNPSFFAHPLAASGFTLAHPDRSIREFWIRHGIASRKIGAAMGRALGATCITNHWMPDGYKDSPADRLSPRQRMLESLDAVFAEPIPAAENLDALESKLFGIGVESYTVGSHEFYLGYATSRQKIICYDVGHFHPTETITDKISSSLLYVPGILLHLSRGVRWDSDHVATLTDDMFATFQEIVRGNFLDRTYISMDYFDASINRLAAWVIGVRNARKALLAALLEPYAEMLKAEESGDFTSRLVQQEENKLLPLGAVWNEFCKRHDKPIDGQWLSQVKAYEANVLVNRN
ncbi:MAG: L-rhamnose isomerase [Lentisphaerae bacterium]|jgi:L-rhamnose isomerase|nr:L-rhamnose isomerase [Lentisphaerota bacterium]